MSENNLKNSNQNKFKNFTALGQLMQQAQIETKTESEKTKQASSISQSKDENMLNASQIALKQANSQNLETGSSKELEIKKLQPNKKNSSKKTDKSYFVPWSTYIRPEFEKQLKIRAIEQDKEIYRLLDQALSKFLKPNQKN